MSTVVPPPPKRQRGRPSKAQLEAEREYEAYLSSLGAQAPDGGAASTPVPVGTSQGASGSVQLCGNDKGGPSLATLLQEVSRRNPKHAYMLDLFEACCQSYGWNGCGCEYSESGGHGTGSSAYAQLHGASVLLSEVRGFFGDFMTRKTDASFAETKRCVSAIRALITHSMDVGALERSGGRELLKELRVNNKFNGEKLGAELQRLADEGYWDSLEEPASSGSDDRSPGGHADAEDYRSGDCHVEIKAVRADGWVLGAPDWYLERVSFNWNLERVSFGDPDEEVFVQLPDSVAQLGVVGAGFSCMSLEKKRGVWRPVGTFDEMYVFANVYPPQ